MEGRWIYPTPGYRPEKVSAEVSEGNVRKQISEAGQGGKQQAVLRPLTEITLVSIENIKKIYIHSNKTLDTNVLGSITQNTVVKRFSSVSSVQSLSCVRLFMTPWITAHQTSLSITNSQSLLKLMSIELVMPSSHLILCRPLLLLPRSLPVSGSFPMSQFFAWGGQSIGVSASAAVLPVNTQDWSPLGWTGWISLSKVRNRQMSITTYEWINKIWYVHTMEYYSARERTGVCYNIEEPWKSILCEKIQT